MMRGQDVWIGMPYDVFFYTVLHELVAGWLDAELGEFHLHIGSLYIYDEHIEQADMLTSLPASEIMPDLRTPWNGFGGLLDQVEACDVTGHPGWDAMAETLRSYRLWKDGKREQVWRAADTMDGPSAKPSPPGTESWSGARPPRARRQGQGDRRHEAHPSVVLGPCSYTPRPRSALLVDGELVGFVEEERLSEQKHTKLYPARAVGWLLDQAKLSATDVDAVAYNFQPARYLAESPVALRMAPSSATRDRSLACAHGFARGRPAHPAAAARPRQPVPRPASHRSCTTEPTSSRPTPPPAGTKRPYSSSTASASGRPPRSPTATARSAPPRPHPGSDQRPGLLGYVYGAVTEHLGWRRGDEEGTVMALAALGDPARFRHLFTTAVRTTATGFRIHPGYFPTRTLTSGYPRTSRRFVAETCPGAAPERAAHRRPPRSGGCPSGAGPEQVMVHLARRACVLTGSRRLCVGGGASPRTASASGRSSRLTSSTRCSSRRRPETPEPPSGPAPRRACRWA
ncbi:thymidylate synthase [Streptomyces thinghirensis]|nr:thymidylate synthase [Streptomyces thinghirensis]